MKPTASLPALLALIAFSACNGNAETTHSTQPAPKTHAGGGEHAASMDIVDTAVGNGSFTILADLLGKASLVDALKGDGPFTVFAPTDEAFKKLPAETLAALGKDPSALANVLKYHVVSGKVMAKDASSLSSAAMLNGTKADIVKKDGALHIAGAKIVSTDIACSNGVIHVIDSVMLP